MLKIIKTLLKKTSGFTLMEIIVVMGIFITTILVITDIFFTVNRVQRRTQLTQEIQSDARFVIEAMAREIRLGTIAYDIYQDYTILPALNPFCPEKCDLENLTNSSFPILIIRDQGGNIVTYMRSPADTQNLNNTLFDFDGDKVWVCSHPQEDLDPAGEETGERCTPTSNLDLKGFQSVTPPNVVIKDLKFYISPRSNPNLAPPTSSSDCHAGATFDRDTGVCALCVTDDNCFEGQSCTSNVCVNSNEQPKVTIVLVTETESEKPGEMQESYMQTTVTSRIYER